MKMLNNVVAKAQATVPIDRQLQGVHAYQKARMRFLGIHRPEPLVERPLPPVDELDLAEIDVSNPFLYRQGLWKSYFARLREEAPVHFRAESPFGPFWSVTKYDDILTVDKDHETFSAEPVIVIGSFPPGLDVEMFIAMDPPKHDLQRQAVQHVVAPKNLQEMEALIRQRVCEVLDSLPANEPFNWVEEVSIELTARMLATLLDYPYEDRQKLVYWSDLAASAEEMTGGPSDYNEMFRGLGDMARHFTQHWHDKAARRAAGEAPGYDLITLLQSNESTKDLVHRPMEFIGNLMLLIVGGNDTTRNSMTGSVFALNQFPAEYAKLKADPSLIPNMVSETIRWQTPLSHMRRIAKKDTVLNGQFIRKGDKVVMWYVSGNRDESKFENADSFIIDRPNARNHISFGFGVHRCMGNRLADMQLRILWEELLPRFEDIKVIGEPEYVQSNFVRGYDKLMVELTPKKQKRA
jgi:cytochrome P450